MHEKAKRTVIEGQMMAQSCPFLAFLHKNTLREIYIFLHAKEQEIKKMNFQGKHVMTDNLILPLL